MAGKNWEDFIQVAKLGGVEFDMISVDDDHGHEWDKQEFPGRPGAFLEDRAAKARVVDALAIFVDDAYPDTMNALIALIDAGGVLEFVHPIYGSMQVGAERGKVRHDAEDAFDCASMTLTLTEHTDRALGPVVDRTTIAALAQGTRSAADGVTAAGAALATALGSSALPALLDAANLGAGIAANAYATADDFEQNGDALSLAEVQASSNASLTQISKAVDAISDWSTPEMYAYGVSLEGLAAALGALGTAVAQTRPPLVSQVVSYDTSLRVFAWERYGDSDRADELLALNSIADPLFLRRGTTLRLYAA